MAEVHQETRAELSSTQVRATTKYTTRRNRCRWAIVYVRVAVIRLKETKTKPVIEPRQIVVHTAAGNQARAPGVGLVLKSSWNLRVRATNTHTTH